MTFDADACGQAWIGVLTRNFDSSRDDTRAARVAAQSRCDDHLIAGKQTSGIAAFFLTGLYGIL